MKNVDKMAHHDVTDVPSKPFAGQKPGTSGLRKKVQEFTQPHYMETFIQCTLLAVGDRLKGSTLVVGGDGRYGMKLAVSNIIKIAAANKVRRFYDRVKHLNRSRVPTILRMCYLILV